MSVPAAPSLSRLWRALLIASVFLLIWSTKLYTIGRFGSDLPYWDQWAKEGELFYAPWFDRHEFWHNLFVPHNEHRIAPTLAMNLGLLRLGGDQWDARVQCAASAALHAALAAALAAWALRRFRTGWAVAAAVLLVIVTAPPIAWENVLGGFQSQFYFLAIFSLLAIGGLLGSRAFSWRWFGGIAAAALAAVSMGSGMLVAFPIAVIAAMRTIRPSSDLIGSAGDATLPSRRPPDSSGDATPSSRWFGNATGASRPQNASPADICSRFDTLATLIVAILIGAIGWWFRPQAPWHAAIHAHSLGQSLLYAIRCLSWPLYGSPWFALVVWAPWVVLGFATLRNLRTRTGDATRPSPAVTAGKPPSSRWAANRDEGVAAPEAAPAVPAWARSTTTDFILAGGLWVLVQVAAVSYSRAGGGDMPAPRYGDICALGVAFSFFALAVLLGAAASASEPRRALPRTRLALTAGWLLAAVIAVASATRTELHTDLPQKHADSVEYERNVQAFILTDDYAAMDKQQPHLPFPLTDWLARMLRNPTLRRLLPESVRTPLHVAGLGDDATNPAPPLAHRATRTVTAGADWTGAVLPSGRGWWKIETAGDIGFAGAELDVVRASDHHVLARVAPTKPSGNTWRAAYVPAPHEPAQLVAHVSAPSHWLAFSEPVVVSSLGYRTWRLTLNAPWLALIGAAGLLAAIAGVSTTNR